MKKYYRSAWIGLPLFLILAISIMIHASWIGQFDHFFEQITHALPNLQSLMLGISFLAAPKIDIVWMLIIALILWIKHQRPLAMNIIVLLLSADGLGWIIKHIVRRARPVQHLAADDGYSFPSGHVLGMSLLVFWLLMILLPEFMKNQTHHLWLNVILIIWLLLVMIARVYVYAHYPSDVLGSVLLALTWFGILEWIWFTITPHTKKNTF